jgi:hypothetical protein
MTHDNTSLVIEIGVNIELSILLYKKIITFQKHILNTSILTLTRKHNDVLHVKHFA